MKRAALATMIAMACTMLATPARAAMAMPRPGNLDSLGPSATSLDAFPVYTPPAGVNLVTQTLGSTIVPAGPAPTTPNPIDWHAAWLAAVANQPVQSYTWVGVSPNPIFNASPANGIISIPNFDQPPAGTGGAPTPEPSTYAMIGMALLGIGLYRRKK